MAICAAKYSDAVGKWKNLQINIPNNPTKIAKKVWFSGVILFCTKVNVISMLSMKG